MPQPFEKFDALTGRHHGKNAVALPHAGKLVYFDDKGKLQTDPGWWRRVRNHVQAHIADLGKLGPAGSNPHSMERDVKLCEKNPAAQLFRGRHV